MNGKLSTVGLFLALLALPVSGCAGPSVPIIPGADESSATALARPGDEINGMALTTGALNLVPIWELCLAFVGTFHDCPVSAGRPVGIGPNTLLMGAGGGVATWDRQHWQLYLDNEPIDLPAFGTFDFVRFAKEPDGQTELARRCRAWDVAIKPAPGHHTLRALLRVDAFAVAGLALARPGPLARQWEARFVAASPNLVALR